MDFEIKGMTNKLQITKLKINMSAITNVQSIKLTKAEKAVVKAEKEQAAALAKAEKEQAAALAKADKEQSAAKAKAEKEQAKAAKEQAKADKEQAAALAKAEKEQAAALAKTEKEQAAALAKTEKEQAAALAKTEKEQGAAQAKAEKEQGATLAKAEKEKLKQENKEKNKQEKELLKQKLAELKAAEEAFKVFQKQTDDEVKSLDNKLKALDVVLSKEEVDIDKKYNKVVKTIEQADNLIVKEVKKELKEKKKSANDSIITFQSGKNDYRSLSNFHLGEVKIDDCVYESGEHAFHGEKFKRLSTASKIVDRCGKLNDHAIKFQKPSSFKTPIDAKRAGGKKGLKLTPEEIEQWSTISADVQGEICKYKLENDEVVKTDLAKSGLKLLVHTASRFSKIENCYWEGRASVDESGELKIEGRNMLGKIWMDNRGCVM
jgi:predicted NAD-dependent protein-ADP-ribosyltransferase YbiA (DUF1768 family)